jgi:antitoxin HicB
MYYPAKIEPDTTGFMVSFRDIPEALTQGDTEDEARQMAADALLTAMDFYVEDNRPVPWPSAARDGEALVALPASAWAKVLLLNEMLTQHVGPSELARRLGTTKQQATRLTDLSHATKIDALAGALAALGRRLELGVR